MLRLRCPNASTILPAPVKHSTQEASRVRSMMSRNIISFLLAKRGSVTTLALPATEFRLVWVIVVGAHTLCAVFLASLAAVYSYLTNPVMAYYVQLWAPSSGNRNYGIYSVIFGLVGVLNVLRVVQLIHRSIRERQLTFRRGKLKTTTGSATATESSTSLAIIARLTRDYRQNLKVLAHSARQGWRALFSQSGLFGVESQYFLTIFVIREVVELITQTYQAQRSSHLLPRVGLNTILVTLLVANCWSTLTVHHFLGRQPALERVVALSADVFICMVMVIVVPIVILAPYIAVFDMANHRFNESVSLYDPIFMATLVLETRLVLVSNFADFVAKSIPHVAIYLSLTSISSLTTRHSTPIPKLKLTAIISSIVVKPTRTDEASPSIRTMEVAAATQRVPRIKSSMPSGSNRTFSQVVHKAGKGLFCIWGVVVITLHLHAMYVSESSTLHGCRASTRPWLMNHVSCSSLVINCHKYDSDSPSESIFDQIDLPALTTLTLAHCPSLRSPSALSQFQNLMILHVYNSTVVEWENKADTMVNPRLLTLIVARSNLTPRSAEGLLQSVSLSTVQFCNTNLAKLPNILPWSSHPMAVVAFDYGQLTAFPAAIMALQAYAISLKGNRLGAIHELAQMPPGQVLYSLELTDNPLRELPVELASPTNSIITLDLQNTNVSTLPSWTKTRVLGVIYMHGTPYCANTRVELQQRNAICRPRPAEDQGMQSPLELFNVMYPYWQD